MTIKIILLSAFVALPMFALADGGIGNLANSMNAQNNAASQLATYNNYELNDYSQAAARGTASKGGHGNNGNGHGNGHGNKAPIDGGLSLLIAAGAGAAVKKMAAKKKENKEK